MKHKHPDEFVLDHAEAEVTNVCGGLNQHGNKIENNRTYNTYK